MSRSTLAALVVLLAAGVGLLQSGCTAVGYYIGYKMDQAHGAERQVAREDAERIPAGRPITVALASGDTLSGTMDGVVHLPDTIAGQPVDSSIGEADNIGLPSARDSIIVTSTNERTSRCVFAGFDRHKAAIRYERGDQQYALPMESIKQISDVDGNRYDLRRWTVLTESIVKSRTGHLQMWLGDVEAEQRRIPLQEIELLTYQPATSNYQGVGMLMGMLVDAALITAAVQIQNDLSDL